MYFIMLLSLAFYTIGAALLAVEMVKKKPVQKVTPPEYNLWKDDDEWNTFRRKRNRSTVNLSF